MLRTEHKQLYGQRYKSGATTVVNTHPGKVLTDRLALRSGGGALTRVSGHIARVNSDVRAQGTNLTSTKSEFRDEICGHIKERRSDGSRAIAWIRETVSPPRIALSYWASHLAPPRL